MKIRIVSLFPEEALTVGRFGVVGRAREAGLVDLDAIDPREFAGDRHRTVDGRPYGGGPGMVMRFEPLAAAIDAALGAVPAGAPVIYLSPQGRVFDQPAARRLAALPGLVLVAGRYEGVDERLIEARVDEELSLGDFVLSGGEIAAMAVVDAVTRLLPGTLGHEASAGQDSFMDGLLDYPHYTRPERIEGRPVPAALVSGDHAAIERWRRREALGRTWERRPDLLAAVALGAEDRELLAEYRARRASRQASPGDAGERAQTRRAGADEDNA